MMVHDGSTYPEALLIHAVSCQATADGAFGAAYRASQGLQALRPHQVSL